MPSAEAALGDGTDAKSSPRLLGQAYRRSFRPLPAYSTLRSTVGEVGQHGANGPARTGDQEDRTARELTTHGRRRVDGSSVLTRRHVRRVAGADRIVLSSAVGRWQLSRGIQRQRYRHHGRQTQTPDRTGRRKPAGPPARRGGVVPPQGKPGPLGGFDGCTVLALVGSPRAPTAAGKQILTLMREDWRDEWAAFDFGDFLRPQRPDGITLRNTIGGLSDDDLGAVLICIDGARSVRSLRLTGCSLLTGRGIGLLRESTVLERVDISLVKTRDHRPGACGLELDQVLPVLDSIISNKENKLRHIQLPKKWRSEKDASLDGFIGRYNHALDLMTKECCQCEEEAGSSVSARRAPARTTGNLRSSTAPAARSTSATNVAPYFGAQSVARQFHARIAGSVLGAVWMSAATQARFVPSALPRRRSGWTAASAPSATAATEKPATRRPQRQGADLNVPVPAALRREKESQMTQLMVDMMTMLRTGEERADLAMDDDALRLLRRNQ
ncbi:hypothetical protein THAOC_33196 [Thalassiosira oceanica]|uniref:Uncharacterized protein n=1 Tax=Thalassiosira oceanica TaxID=159749 RepID=K0R7K8_THAOC|nr:hypothetical protein THAOC_33196 [Thalassiosira oceanica]|eukprot:EJK48044.1 hypothetical protein THAOC_33196 [Thalassiosira oceanica]